MEISTKHTVYSNTMTHVFHKSLRSSHNYKNIYLSTREKTKYMLLSSLTARIAPVLQWHLLENAVTNSYGLTKDKLPNCIEDASVEKYVQQVITPACDKFFTQNL